MPEIWARGAGFVWERVVDVMGSSGGVEEWQEEWGEGVTEMLKKEKEGLDNKLTGFQSASKDLDNLIGSQRSDKNKEGLGYSDVPPAQVYSLPKKDISWIGLPKFADDTITNYTRPSPKIESKSKDLQNNSSFVSENGESTSDILSKPEIKFVKATDSPTVIKTNKDETVRNPSVKYTKMYRKTLKSSNVRGNQRNWDNLKSQQLGKNFLMKNKACFNCGKFDHLSYTVNNIDDKGYWDSGCSRHMTDNISYLSDYEPYDGGTPRQHNIHLIDLNNVVPHKDLTFLVAKASADKCMLWHRRLGYLYFKTMNKLVRHNLVRGLPSKCFENDNSFVACLKGKQHKASCKTMLVNSVTKPLHTLHMDLFGPTFVSSLNHKWYCLVVTDDFSRKGIKREFNNARTPQQNGVSERINRTLIEVAKTILADAKLFVTFWAEAVNTACYVQNRVLANKSQNKTSYEIFNGRTPAIGFLKPFGCHVMILNTLDHLGKFEAKGDEEYFIGYSMSSKVFRVFNKRTKRVEENLHVDFLENKAIEKEASPNWLFDIDSLTNFMNYVLVVVAGINSTNFLGTKDVASQEVKKDVSSLRYIALLNWFHEAHLESSSSNAQDACNVDAPKNSGNFNPTATTTNPSADQMETLTVETLILTVSSPVLTAILNDSPETSSDTRLNSKRVTSQDDTPSLDNILTLSKRFKDILRVTTYTGDTNGVEADLSNMEINISASPTPTFRIYKDHSTSQIIDPMDTLVQTRNKSKEIEEQSFIASIHHKTNPDLLQFCLFSCFLSQEEPKKIFDAFKDPIYQMDVKSAFLYGTIDEEVYVMQPPRFQDPEFPAKVYKVEKAMYGLHQAPRAWYGTLSKYLLTNGFQRGTTDQTLFIRKHRGDFLLVQVYVDDIIFGSSNPQLCREFEALMHEKFQMSAMGELNFFLGLKVLQKKDGIFLSQDKYVSDILKKFGYSDVRSANTPMDKENPWGKDETGKDVDLHLYRSMIGSLMYLTASRLDIMFTIKYEHNVDFHQIVDFVEASHLRIETTNEGTKILATVDGKPRTISESSIRRNIKLRDEAEISSLSDAELFENLTLMGAIPLFPTMLVTMGEGSRTPTEPHHTPFPEAPLSLQHDLSSSIHPPVSTTTIPTVIPTKTLPRRQYTKRARIAQSSALLTIAGEPASPLGDDSQELTDLCTRLQRQQDEMVLKITAQDLEISTLKARIKLLEDEDGGGVDPSRDDATIKGRSLETEEEAGIERSTDKGSNDIEEMVATVSIPPASEIPTVSVPTGSGVVPTASPIFTTATVATPYSRRKGKEKMVELETPKKKKLQEQMIHAEEELQMQIDGLDRNNETVAKYLHEYEQFDADLSIGEMIELINDLVKYQDNYAKVLKYQTQQRKPLSKKQQREFYKSIEYFVPIGSKEEGERFKRKGLRLEQDSAKKVKTSEEVSEEDLKIMMQLVPVEEVYVEALQHFDREDLNQLCRDYPLRKGIAIVMISNKLQVENYSQMANDLIMKIHQIANSPRQRGIPTASDEFPLPEDFPTASEERFPLLRKRDATAEEVCTANKDKSCFERLRLRRFGFEEVGLGEDSPGRLEEERAVGAYFLEDSSSHWYGGHKLFHDMQSQQSDMGLDIDMLSSDHLPSTPELKLSPESDF
nr:putative ribonuclease H-like domain-containing protein [Tanacetum cinerariifolium]